MGMWLFLITEVMFFGGLFLLYTVYRMKYPAAFAEASHELNILLGGINTVVLIGSSLTIVLAVHAAEHDDRRGQVKYLILTLLLAGVFLVIKAFEYGAKFAHHHVPGPHFHFEGEHAGQVELFLGLYFAMTGMHALHMVIGMVILVMLIVQARRGRFGSTNFTWLENFGLYWHFVDIVWIFLFPLLYLIGRH